MENEAITMELGQSSASKGASVHVEQTERTSSLSYIPGSMQSMVDELLAELSNMEDPFEQMNFIILKLMPAVLAEQEQSIAAIAPLIESNKEYNERLASLQGKFGKWGTTGENLTNEKAFFEEVDSLTDKLTEDTSYGVQEEMLDSVNRISENADAMISGTKLTHEQAALNSLNAPYSGFNPATGGFEHYPIADSTSNTYDKAMNNTNQFQPFADQTGQELEILKGLNVNMAKQVELDLKYKVEFYNSYVSSIGSMEDNTSKQRRTPIDRLQS